MTSKYNCGGPENTNTFAYDGLGNLMKKSNPLIGDTIFVYDVFRNMAAEYGAGAMEACSPCYLFQDPVWTVRLTVDQTQPVVKRFDVMPFGEQISGGWVGEWEERECVFAVFDNADFAPEPFIAPAAGSS